MGTPPGPLPDPLRGLGRLRRFLARELVDWPPRRKEAAGDEAPNLPPLYRDVPAKSPDHIRFFSLNAAHGRRTATHQALLRKSTAERNVKDIAQVVRDLDADVVALQEADGPSAWSGNFDHVAAMARHAGFHDHFRGDHNPFRFGSFQLFSGTALLARSPLADKGDHAFRTIWRDTKGFVVAAMRVPQWGDHEIDIASVHLDFLRPSVRRRQILQMVGVLERRKRPLVLLGDFNLCFRRDIEVLNLFETTLGVRPHGKEDHAPTFPSTRPRHRLDWVLVSPDLRFTEYHTLRTPLSDHLGLVVDIDRLEPGEEPIYQEPTAPPSSCPGP